ncbi:MFS transporter [bacterium]|nr:MFS transporter [bacterium]
MTAPQLAHPPARLFQGVRPFHLFAFLACWLGGVFDGLDSTVMAMAMPQALGELLGGAGPAVVGLVGGWISSAFLLGWMLGGLGFGYLGDRIGRVKAMVISVGLYSVFTGLAGFSPNWQVLLVCRFLTGIGVGGELVAITTYLSEVWPERSRAIAVGALITSYSTGVFLAGALHYRIHDWRLLFMVGALPALLAVLLRWGLREPERWQAQRGAPGRLLKHLLAPEHRKGLLVGAVAYTSLLVGYWGTLAWVPTWAQALPGSPAEVRSLVTLWNGVGSIVGCLLAGVLAQALGRRKGLMLGFAGAFGAAFWLFAGHGAFSPRVYAATAMLGLCLGLTQAGLSVYLPELFPTAIRGSAAGFCLNVGRLVTAIAVLGVGPLVALFGGFGPMALVFAGIFWVGLVAAWLGTETKGEALPA